jgi:uroporphyrinogen decarboxylase
MSGDSRIFLKPFNGSKKPCAINRIGGESMNSVERVQKVLSGEVPDRVPVALHNYLMACRLAGGRFDRLLADGEALAEAQLNAWRQFGHDVIMLENGVCAEAAAMGCVIRYPADGPPHVEEPFIKKLDDINKLRVPDPETTFPLNELLKTTRIVKKETGGEVFINGRSDQGPIALASALTGPERFLTMLIDPECHAWCLQMLKICRRMNVALGTAQCNAGAHSSTIGLAGTSVISPAFFDKYELPGAQEFCTALRGLGCHAFVHTCGNETHLLSNLIATGADCLELDPGTDPALCKQAVRGRTCVLGMIDPAQVMRFGSPETVRQHAREILRIMGPGGGFIAGPGCALPADTPPENVFALMDTVRRDGVYGDGGALPRLA